jgi:hypothetical protein
LSNPAKFKRLVLKNCTNAGRIGTILGLPGFAQAEP